jgi:hypothetical protein
MRFGAKSHAACSTLVVGPAELTPSLGASDMKVRTTASASTGAWKEQVRAASGAATPGNLLTGAIGPDLEFRLSSARNRPGRLRAPVRHGCLPLVGFREGRLWCP